METADELTLRDLVEVLSRKRALIIVFTLAFGLAAAVYAFLLAENVYEATAVVSVTPLQVRAELEDKIKLQPVYPLTTSSLEALLTSEPVVGSTTSRARELEAYPAEWDTLSPLEVDFAFRKLADVRVSREARSNNPSLLIATLTFKARDPAVAATVANAWASEAAKTVNELPAKQIRESLNGLETQLTEAEQAFRKAQEDWETFQSNSLLELWKYEIELRAEKASEQMLDIDTITQLLSELQAKKEVLSLHLRDLSQQLTANAGPETLLLIDRDVAEAAAALEGQVQTRRKAYDEARNRLEQLQANLAIEQWQTELSKAQGRLAEIEVRLERINTETARLYSQLQTARAQLAKQPQTLLLKREVTSDPVAALPLAQRGGMEDLAGLTLENEVLNTLYTNLLDETLVLERRLEELNAERNALKTERENLGARTESLRAEIAKAEKAMADATLILELNKTAYTQALERLRSFDGAPPELRLTNPTPLYQQLRSELTSTNVAIAEQETRLEMVREDLDKNLARIAELRRMIAGDELESDRLKETLRLTREAFLALKQKQTDLKIELASIQNNLAQVIAPAYPNPDPVAPRRAMITALALTLGLMFGVFSAFISAALEASPTAKEPAASPHEA